MGVVIPPPLPLVQPAQNPQPRPELVIVAPQRPVAPQTTRAVVGASGGRNGNKAADSDTKRAEEDTAPEAGASDASPRPAPTAQPKSRGGKVSIEI